MFNAPVPTSGCLVLMALQARPVDGQVLMRGLEQQEAVGFEEESILLRMNCFSTAPITAWVGRGKGCSGSQSASRTHRNPLYSVVGPLSGAAWL